MLIIKSNKANWEGKGFSEELPAKIYMDFDDACSALNSYHFYGYEDGKFVAKKKNDKLEFIFLKEENIGQMIAENKIRH